MNIKIAKSSGGFDAAFFMAPLIRFSSRYDLTWRSPKLFAMVMDTTAEPFMGWGHISPIILSKCYLLVLCKGGVHGMFIQSWSLIVHMMGSNFGAL